MKNQIIVLDEKNRKVFGFTDDQIIISSKGHKSFDTLLASTAKPGMLETVKTIEMADVRSIQYNEKETGFTIAYDRKGKLKKDSPTVNDEELRHAVVLELAALKGYSESIIEEPKVKPLLINLFWVLLIAFFTWVARGMALDAQNGEHYVATGRKRGLAQLVGDTIEAIGPLGVTLIGVGAFLYMMYRSYDRYTNPAQEVKYN